jgi:quercetin dioxygenase-like cupin family protein
MKGSIVLIAIGYLTFSCTPHSKTAENSNALPLKDGLQKEKSTRADGTEIDFVKSSPDKTKILLENEYVRVIEYSLQPGEKDSTHTHPPKTSYVLSGGTLRVYPENEKPFDAAEVTGTAAWAGRRGKHYVENIGKTTVTIVLTEIKSAQ